MRTLVIEADEALGASRHFGQAAPGASPGSAGPLPPTAPLRNGSATS
ncbi:hypothetical protein ACWFR5_26110 [Streptomyces sp. NPDC055092]